MTFTSVFTRRRAPRVFAVMPMMIAIPMTMMMVMMVVAIAMSRGRTSLVGVLEMRRVHDAFRGMRTRLMILESVNVAEFLAAIGF